jgi:hypothetical protein
VLHGTLVVHHRRLQRERTGSNCGLPGGATPTALLQGWARTQLSARPRPTPAHREVARWFASAERGRATGVGKQTRRAGNTTKQPPPTCRHCMLPRTERVTRARVRLRCLPVKTRPTTATRTFENLCIMSFDTFRSVNIPSSFDVNWNPHSVCSHHHTRSSVAVSEAHAPTHRRRVAVPKGAGAKQAGHG